jgi:radical SAM superfamily enzyme YgiQ (UPF0313 family)
VKTLLVNPEFPPSFWSLPISVRMVGAKTVSPPLGLLTVAALLPRHWELRLVDLNTGTLSADDWQWAEMVMLTGMYVQKQSLLDTLTEAKKRGKITVVGGPYATSCTDEVRAAGCDFLFLGEAENTIQEFLSALEKQEGHGTYSSDEKPDLSKSPVPRYDLLNLNDYTTLLVQTSRGCPFDCEFCDVVNLFGRNIRYKEPEQVTEEMEAIFHLGWRGDVFLCDDNFIGSRRSAHAILAKLISWSRFRGDPFGFTTQASVNLGVDRETVDLMTEANFSTVFIGIETPDTAILERNRKLQNTRSPLVESVNAISRNGLSVVASFIVGFDGEKEGAGERICEFAEETAIPILMVNTLIAPGNTRLWKRLEAEGRLRSTVTDGDSIGDWPNFVTSRPVEQIMEEFVSAWEHLYEPQRFLERSYRYHLAMRPTRAASAAAQGIRLPAAEVKRARPSFRKMFYDVHALFLLVWFQGVMRPCRAQFWKNLRGMLKHNPSRIKRYLMSCAVGESMFRQAAEMRKKVFKA